MVSFSNTKAPVGYESINVSLKPRKTQVFTDKIEIIGNDDTMNEDEISEEVVGVNFGNGRLDKSDYLFTGQIEIHYVDKTSCYGSKNGNELKPGLRIVIRKYTGEWVGTVIYDYMINQDKKCVDLGKKRLIKTLYHIFDERYVVYVHYGGEFVALRMDLCPGDEEELEKIIKEYEDKVNFN
jgi:hypothetical protein